MRLVDYIKADRRMSLNHWRFRLLYWCFHVPPGTPPEQSGLPQFLFSHYCPLFHFTNLIAALSWLIFAIRVTVVICKVIGGLIGKCWDMIEWAWFGAALNWVQRQIPKPAPLNVEEIAAQTRRRWRQELVNAISRFQGSDFDVFMRHTACMLSREEAKQIWDEVWPRVLAARERARERERRFRESIVFWVNASRGVIKTCLWIAYVAAALLALWIGYHAIGWGWWALCGVTDFVIWLFWLLWDAPYVSILRGTAIGLGLVAIPIGAVLLIFRFASPIGDAVRTATSAVPNPFFFVKPCWRFVGRWCAAVYEWCAMFWADNCPAIELISPEQEQIEQAVQE